ncbi:MAG: hypothetical protein M1834_004942 [Cirrosporium novae-zelandiae]|nr:MAG: hypothetical protein M1834_004942 [Cirrosporium novae-zelandiae]
MNGAGMPVKTEGSYPANGLNPYVKPDSENKQISFEDDDLYEDTGDVDFSNAGREVWLTRIPKFLWERWSKLDDDEEIHLGTVRIEHPANQKEPIVSLRLFDNLPQNADIPKEYNMHVSNLSANNTFVFSEKDLPGYASKMGTGSPAPDMATKDIKRPDTKFKIDKKKRYQDSYRKAIPKQTAIAGSVKTELNCIPVENSEYMRLFSVLHNQAVKPKRQTQFLAGKVGTHGGNLLNPGTIGTGASFDNFIKTTNDTNKRKGNQALKAARLPKNELLDAIFKCFQRYQYWYLKSLKAELMQPEAYLKEVLQEIAKQNRSGDYANTWELKPEWKMSAYAQSLEGPGPKVEVAPDMGGDDDENMRMEDVL